MPSKAVPNKGDGSLEGILNPDGSQKRLVKTNGFPVKAKQIIPRMDILEPDEIIFPDVEGSRLSLQSGNLLKGKGRVGIAIRKGTSIKPKWVRMYDTYVRYEPMDQQEPGWSKKSGVYADDLLEENYARPIAEVMENVRAIFTKSGVIMGHSLINEQQYLRGLPWPEYTIFDIQTYSGFKQHAKNIKDPKPSLKDLASVVLHRVIQERQHDPIEDYMAGGDPFFMYEAEIRAEQSSPEAQGRLLWQLTKPELDAWAEDPTVKALGDRAWFPEGAKRPSSDKAKSNGNVTTGSTTDTVTTANEKSMFTIVTSLPAVSISTAHTAQHTQASSHTHARIDTANDSAKSAASIVVNPKHAASSNFWGQFKR